MSSNPPDPRFCDDDYLTPTERIVWSESLPMQDRLRAFRDCVDSEWADIIEGAAIEIERLSAALRVAQEATRTAQEDADALFRAVTDDDIRIERWGWPGERAEDLTDCPICPVLATDRDDALAEVAELRSEQTVDDCLAMLKERLGPINIEVYHDFDDWDVYVHHNAEEGFRPFEQAGGPSLLAAFKAIAAAVAARTTGDMT